MKKVCLCLLVLFSVISNSAYADKIYNYRHIPKHPPYSCPTGQDWNYWSDSRKWQCSIPFPCCDREG